MNLSGLLLKQSIWRSLNYISAFILNICISRVFSAEGSGIYFYIINYFSFLVLLTSLSLESGIGYFIPSGKINNVSIAFLAILWIAVVGFLCFWGFPWWSGWIETDWPQETLRYRATIFIIGSMLSAYFIAILNANFRYGFSNLIIFFTNLLLSFLFVLSYFFNSFSTDTLTRFLFLNYLVQGIVIAVYFLFSNTISFSYKNMRLAAYKQLLRYSLFAFIINIISFLLSRFDYFLVRRFCRESDLGNYILANKMAQLFYLFPAILASVFFNYTAKGGENGTAYSVARTSRILSLGYVALFLILFACNELFTLVFGESFDKTHSLVVLMMPGILLFGIGHLLTAYLSGKNRLSAIFISTLIALIALIILDIIFIPLYGVYAASVVTSIAYILLFFLLAYFLRKYDDISFVKLLILNKDDWQYVKDLFTRLISKK